jgi:hypothetical protein
VPGPPGAGGWSLLILAGSCAWLLALAGAPLAVSPTRGHATAIPYADGAAPGFTGGGGEQACDACHFEAAPNTPPGRLAVEGLPERFAPGERYPVTVTLSRPGMKMAGFQLAVRFADGTQAGTLAAGPDDQPRVAVETQGGIQYANQKRPGTTLTGTDTARWSLVWTAPSTGGPVSLHVSANAADGDDSARGDYVFTATASSAPR